MKKHYTLLIIFVLALGLICTGCMEINSSNTLNRSDDITIDLTVLTNDELERYELFCDSYDEDYLINANPESIMKMYITSAIKEDYETQYQLYTKNTDYISVSKDDYLKIMEDAMPFDKTIFEKVYDLSIEISQTDVSHAYITWKSKNGYVDEDGDPFVYGFSLQKDEEVWRVSFSPMN